MIEYMVVSGRSSSELARQVNEYLKRGWELYGFPYGLAPGGMYDPLHCQAMIREVEDAES